MRRAARQQSQRTECRHLTAHREAVAEEVARVSDKNDETRLDFGVFIETRVLQHERARQSKDDSERHRSEEDEQEDPDTVEEGEDVDLLAMELRQGPDVRKHRRTSARVAVTGNAGVVQHSLKHYDGHCVIEDALAKDDAVQLWVDFKSVKNGELSNHGGRQERISNLNTSDF